MAAVPLIAAVDVGRPRLDSRFIDAIYPDVRAWAQWSVVCRAARQPIPVSF